MRFSKRIIYSAQILALVLGMTATNSFADDSSAQEKVAKALSGFHMAATSADLEALAGGQDQLVSALLVLRLRETPPSVAVRAEKLLIGYSDRPDVAKALQEDLTAPDRAGLARTIAMHAGSAPTADARKSLSLTVVDRAQKEETYRPYARALKESSDEEVRRVARGLPD